MKLPQERKAGSGAGLVFRGALKNQGEVCGNEVRLNPEKPDVPLNKNDAFQKVQKRRVQEKR